MIIVIEKILKMWELYVLIGVVTIYYIYDRIDRRNKKQ
jgi:hypothetical protein